jgi:hypothetical protein
MNGCYITKDGLVFHEGYIKYISDLCPSKIKEKTRVGDVITIILAIISMTLPIWIIIIKG